MLLPWQRCFIALLLLNCIAAPRFSSSCCFQFVSCLVKVHLPGVFLFFGFLFPTADQSRCSFPTFFFFLCSFHQLLKCSAAKGTAEGEGQTTQQAAEEEVQRLSPAVNLEGPVEDDSVRCRMSGICEGLDACGRGMLCLCACHTMCLVIGEIISGIPESLDACRSSWLCMLHSLLLH